MEPLENLQSEINMKNEYKLPNKSSLCRFYLRGNCPYTKTQCTFAHGIQDINFTKYNEEIQQGMIEVYNNFREKHPFNQLDQSIEEQNKNYINLYYFQYELAQGKYQYILNKDNNFINAKQYRKYSNLRAEKKTNGNKSQQKVQNKFKSNSQSKNKQKSQQHSAILKSKYVRNQYEHTYNNREDENHQDQQYNPHKCYTLQEINRNRSLKIQIRKKFHKHQFKLFLQLIQKQYRNQNQQGQFKYRYDILELEYYRVGFNKLMTRIKISFLIDYLQYQFRGGYFKFMTIVPPYLNKTATYYLKIASEDRIISHYRQIYENIVKQFKQSGKQIREQDVRQAMMRVRRDWQTIPPVIQFLKLKHCTFKDFIIRYIIKEEKEQNNSEQNLNWITTQSVLLAEIHKIIEQQIASKEYCIVSNDILNKSSKYSRILVQKCVYIQRKEQTQQNAEDKLILVKCPNIRTQIITKQSYLKPEAKYDHQFGIGLKVTAEDVVNFAINQASDRKNQLQNMQKLENALELNRLNHEPLIKSFSQAENQSKQTMLILKHIIQQIQLAKTDTLQEYKIIDITNFTQLEEQFSQLLFSSTILGVDLEGSLIDPQTGYLSLIQINHFSCKTIYLIDYLTINLTQSKENIQKCKNIISKLLINDNILKVIHDSRNDSENLYNLLKRQRHQFNNNENQIRENGKIQELEEKKVMEHFEDDFRLKFTNIFDTAASQQIIRQIQDNDIHVINTPGLNDVLQKYGQLPNKFKQKFHAIWHEGKQDPSKQRPMSKQFRQYCCMDVLGLPKVYIAMSKKVNPYFLIFISQLHSDLSHAKDSKRKAIQKFNAKIQKPKQEITEIKQQ